MVFKPEHYTAAYWRARAEQVRLEASAMKTSGAKQEMEKIAQGYERLARYVEKAALSEKPPSRARG